MLRCLYARKKSIADLRTEVGSVPSHFVESRSGRRWLSHPEASLSNYLYARGIAHTKGRLYPSSYQTETGRRAIYDLHFTDKIGNEIDVEVWGDDPGGHGAEKYAARREAKEKFHGSSQTFLGIHYLDCLSDDRLNVVLEPYLDPIAPFVFDKSTDAYLETAHWSNADELLETCRKISVSQPDGCLPNEGWLRKRGKFRTRDGPAYNTVAIYIKLWLGGMRNARSLLGQAAKNTKVRSRDAILEELRVWVETYGRSPRAICADVRRGKMVLTENERRRGNALAAAVHLHCGNALAACAKIGVAIRPVDKSTPALNAFKDWIVKYGANPSTIRRRVRRGKLALDPSEVARGMALESNVRRYVGPVASICAALRAPVSPHPPGALSPPVSLPHVP